MSDKNPFGGGNPNSLYVPLSEVEQEVLARLVESGDLIVHVVGWGYIQSPRARHGDLRLQIELPLVFNAPTPPGVPVHFFDLELRTGSGMLLYKSREVVEYGGKPIMVAAGVELGFVWDIMIGAIDPAVVRAIKPGAKGFTSRLQDRDTKEMTLEGNMDLDAQGKSLIRLVRDGEARSRADDAEKVAKAEAKAKPKR